MFGMWAFQESEKAGTKAGLVLKLRIIRSSTDNHLCAHTDALIKVHHIFISHADTTR